jgi:hypothetical protein
VQNGQYIISLSPIDDKPKRQYNRKKKDWLCLQEKFIKDKFTYVI